MSISVEDFRHAYRAKSVFSLLALLLMFSLLKPVSADTLEGKKGPAETHFTIATPGSQWLNVSRPLKPEDLKDRIVLLDFWTYCCINCIQNLPELARLEKEFKDDLLVIGVHSAKFDTEKETDQIRQAVLRYGVEHPVVNDHDFRIWRKFEVRAWPTLVLLRPDGGIERVVTGEGKIPELRKSILALRKRFPKRSNTKIPLGLERDRAAKEEFHYPSKLFYDRVSKRIFVSDSSHHQIAVFKWDEKDPYLLKPEFRLGKAGVSGYRDGISEARFNRPNGLLVAKDVLYVADTGNHAIRRVDLKTKRVSTIAGNGKQGKLLEPKKKQSSSASLVSPWDIVFHPNEGHLVMAMAGTHQLWSMDMKTRQVSVIAGTGKEWIDDGMPGENSLAQPSGLSSLLGSLYFIDAETSALRFYFEGFVRTLVGKDLFDFGFKDGDRKRALLQHPMDVFADVTGIFVADAYNHAIRRYDAQAQKIETVVGDGKVGRGGEEKAEAARKARLNEPSGITKLSDTRFLISDTNNHRLVLWDREANTLQRVRIQGEKPVASPLQASRGAAPARKGFDSKLPNRIAFPDAKVNRLNPEVRILLPERYVLNDAAPTYVAFFEGEGDNPVWRAQWTKKDLGSLAFTLPRLKKGKKYQIQGTVYYCLDAKSSVCEIASFSIPVEVEASGKERIAIEIPLRPTVEKG